MLIAFPLLCAERADDFSLRFSLSGISKVRPISLHHWRHEVVESRQSLGLTTYLNLHTDLTCIKLGKGANFVFSGFSSQLKKKRNCAPRLAWLVLSRVIVAPMCIDLIRTKLSSTWSSRRASLFGFSYLDEALL